MNIFYKKPFLIADVGVNYYDIAQKEDISEIDAAKLMILEAKKAGVDAVKFEKIYDMLLTEIFEALPNIKIMLLGAYVTKGAATEASWDYFSPEVAKRAEVAKRLAQKYNLVYVPLQEKFDEMIEKHPEPYWTQEGVHPTDAGHELIAREWLEGFKML